MKPAKPEVPDSIVVMWVFIWFACVTFAGYLGVRGDGLDWYVSLPLPPGAIPAWVFGPATLLIAALASFATVRARPAGKPPFLSVFCTISVAVLLYTLSEQLLFHSAHEWIASVVLFAAAGLICLVLGMIVVGRYKLASALLVVLAMWFAWTAIGAFRAYKADKETVPTATVSDATPTAHPRPGR
jgi:tryptophan-rich sensory protein